MFNAYPPTLRAIHLEASGRSASRALFASIKSVSLRETPNGAAPKMVNTKLPNNFPTRFRAFTRLAWRPPGPLSPCGNPRQTSEQPSEARS